MGCELHPAMRPPPAERTLFHYFISHFIHIFLQHFPAVTGFWRVLFLCCLLSGDRTTPVPRLALRPRPVQLLLCIQRAPNNATAPNGGPGKTSTNPHPCLSVPSHPPTTHILHPHQKTAQINPDPQDGLREPPHPSDSVLNFAAACTAGGWAAAPRSLPAAPQAPLHPYSAKKKKKNKPNLELVTLSCKYSAAGYRASLLSPAEPGWGVARPRRPFGTGCRRRAAHPEHPAGETMRRGGTAWHRDNI